MAIEEKPIIQDNEDFAPLTPVGPDIYQGKQVIINADRLIFNARKKLEEDTQGAASTYEGGDIHLFSQNFIGLSTKGSIHLNTGFESNTVRILLTISKSVRLMVPVTDSSDL